MHKTRVKFHPSSSKLIPEDEAQPILAPDKTFYLASEASNPSDEIAPTVAACVQQENAKSLAPESSGEQHASNTPETERSVASSLYFFGKQTDEKRLVSDLTEAVECGNFRISFQPIVSLRDGALTGAEACVQWKNRGKFVPASRFIPLAASYGLIDDLGTWVIRHACARIRPVIAGLKPSFRLTVNVLPLQLESGCLLLAIEEGLTSAHIRPENFEIEIYGQMQECSVPVIRKAVKSVQRMGVSVALDEFGASFFSIESLVWFRANRIKIHKSIPAATRVQWPILEGIAQMAKVLRIPTVATGIDALQQLERVRLVGCEEGQGRFIAKSVSAPELLLLVQARTGLAIAPDHSSVRRQNAGDADPSSL